MSSSNLASGVQVNHFFSKVGFFQVEAIVQMNCGFDTLNFPFDIRKCNQDTFVPVDCKVLLPNSFSPNEDGKNDFFQPVASCSFERCEMVVYDRWGQELFFSNRSDDLWNGSNKQGKECWDGLYPYVFQYQLPNEKPKVVKGLIRLIR
jgi:gliding motility-associated-like protein